jgi:hypothetical protein
MPSSGFINGGRFQRFARTDGFALPKFLGASTIRTSVLQGRMQEADMRSSFVTLVLASMAALQGVARGADGIPFAADYSTLPPKNCRFYRGPLFSLKGARSQAVGWLFHSGTAAVEVFRGNWSVPVGVALRQAVFLDECLRISYVVGTQAGICCEGYLGRGFAARLDLRATVPHARISLDWFPCEGVSLSVGLDLLRMRTHAEWLLDDESPFWPGLP